MSKSRRSTSKTGKKSHTPTTTTYRSGRVTRNPFLNFMRDFRKSNSGLKLTELTRRGAELWRKMNDRQKLPYNQLARQAPRRKSRRRRRKGRRRRRHRDDTDEETDGYSSSDYEERKHRKRHDKKSKSDDRKSKHKDSAGNDK